MRIIWCLYGISRAKKLGKSFELITDDDRLWNINIDVMKGISESLLRLLVFDVNASVKVNK